MMPHKLTRLIVVLIVCLGVAPLVQAVGPDTDGNIPGANNGEGVGVLVSRTTGVWNTGAGFEALNHLTSGNQNTATGLRALFNNIDGGFNTATGVYSLFGNTSGFYNNANGAYALAHNTTGTENNALGVQALYLNTTGRKNTALGDLALRSNTTGGFNTATGAQALNSNRTGGFNTADGFQALSSNTTGEFNTAAGGGALFFNTTGRNNIALGAGAGDQLTTGDYNIAIGNGAAPGESGTIRIGDSNQNATYIAGIAGVTLPTGAPVVVDGATGQLGINATSSARFKNRIRSMDKASEAIFWLRPVMFCYNHEIDPNDTTQFGLVAEEVAKVNPDLVVRDKEGKPYSVRYDQVNAMLLNEFLKEHRKNEKQEATIAELKDVIGTLSATVKAQSDQIQKVSAQVELSKSAPQTVLND
jgi:hypothetical protein